MALFEKETEIRELLVTQQATARALTDPVRTALLKLLGHRPMSIDEMTRELAKQGIHKAPTTIRHHVDLLKEAGLVDLVRLEEASGGVLKYYAATAKVLDYELSPELEAELAGAIADTSQDVETWIRSLLKKHGKTIERVAGGMRDCEHCNVKHFKEYVLVRVIQRALAQAMHEESVQRLLKKSAKR